MVHAVWSGEDPRLSLWPEPTPQYCCRVCPLQRWQLFGGSLSSTLSIEAWVLLSFWWTDIWHSPFMRPSHSGWPGLGGGAGEALRFINSAAQSFGLSISSFLRWRNVCVSRFPVMYLVSIILAAVVVLACQGIQAQECPGVPTTTARFRRPISPKCVYGGFFYRPLCTSDPRYSSRRMRLNVQVVFADNCVPVPSGHLITVLQANSWGEETNDCCQTYVTNGQGRWDEFWGNHCACAGWSVIEVPGSALSLCSALRELFELQCHDHALLYTRYCPSSETHVQKVKIIMLSQSSMWMLLFDEDDIKIALSSF